jgi:hypothetical protein
MLSVVKKVTQALFSRYHHTRLKNLLIENKSEACCAKVNESDFIDIILDAEFDKKGKIVKLD